MKKNRTIRVCGSIIKKESLVPLRVNHMENTVVAEANLPYSNYYGNVPQNPKPNSLFLFTACFYTLEEVLRFAQKTDSCLMQNINLATAVINFKNNRYPAIRIKNFPDYEHLPEIQKCLMEQGVEFARKVQLEKEAEMRINKCFVLEKIEKGLYMDKVEKDKGYVLVNKLLTMDEFEELIILVRNNSFCHLFDAVKCSVIIHSEVRELIRIYAENLNVSLLKCISEEVQRLIPRKIKADPKG
jgi:hypothetical protein